jgi:putative acetyltransferase
VKPPPADLRIRPFETRDAEAVLRVHWDAVHHIACADYDAAVLDEWSRTVDAARLATFAAHREADDERIVVAELSGEVVGFGSIVPRNEELRAVYVASRAARRRVGTAILRELERLARQLGLSMLRLNSSRTAEPFYRAGGYDVEGPGEHRLAGGRTMPCVRMSKRFTPRDA